MWRTATKPAAPINAKSAIVPPLQTPMISRIEGRSHSNAHADAGVLEALIAQVVAGPDVTTIDNLGRLHGRLDACEIGALILAPLGDESEHIGAFHGVVG